jgi:hypothetical protein
MEFFIRQGSNEPILKLKLIDDGKNDLSSFNDRLENSVITFEMSDIVTEAPQVLNGQCLLTNKIQLYNQTTPEYYITYRFSSDDTSVKGKYEGIITIQFLDTNSNPTTKLILPINEKLYINVV